MPFFDKNTPIIEKIQIAISFSIRFSLIVAAIGAGWAGRWTVLFVSFLVLFMTFLPALIERNFKIYLPIEFELAVTLFIFGSLFLGEVHDYYTKFWWWDVFLHGGSAIALGFVGFILVYVLWHEKKIKASHFLVALFAFCFALAIGAVWEIFEFAVDQLFGMNMQRSGLVDTMWDLITDAVGALCISFFGYLYLKFQRKGIINFLVTKFVNENQQLFEKGKDW